MLLALKEDNTSGSFCLCRLLPVLSVIIISGYRCCYNIEIGLYVFDRIELTLYHK